MSSHVAYAALLSTFVESFPEKAPPPCAPLPPYVSTIIFLPVNPVSPCGPPITKFPAGLIKNVVLSKIFLLSFTVSLSNLTIVFISFLSFSKLTFQFFSNHRVELKLKLLLFFLLSSEYSTVT